MPAGATARVVRLLPIVSAPCSITRHGHPGVLPGRAWAKSTTTIPSGRPGRLALDSPDSSRRGGGSSSITCRVAELLAYHVRIPLRKPFTHASHTRTSTDNVIIRCTLEDGTIGLGEGVQREYVTGENH